MAYARKKGTPLINAKKTEYKGKKFQSRLEVYMFKLFDDLKINAKYESESFTVVEGFHFSQSSFEKTASSKILVDRGNKKHLGIKYTPDFIIENGEQRIIVEVKGLAMDVFLMRFKLFKKWCTDNNKDYILFTPRNQAQCEFVLQEVIKLLRNPR